MSEYILWNSTTLSYMLILEAADMTTTRHMKVICRKVSLDLDLSASRKAKSYEHYTIDNINRFRLSMIIQFNYS